MSKSVFLQTKQLIHKLIYKIACHFVSHLGKTFTQLNLVIFLTCERKRFPSFLWWKMIDIDDIDDVDYDKIIYLAFGVFGGFIVFFSICCACCNRRRQRKSVDSNSTNNESNHSKRSSQSNDDDGKVYVITNVLQSYSYYS